jgi:hypothetical protein
MTTGHAPPHHALTGAAFCRFNFTKFGVEIEAGGSDRYVVTGNKLSGNLWGGLHDGAKGADAVVQGNTGGGVVLRERSSTELELGLAAN